MTEPMRGVQPSALLLMLERNPPIGVCSDAVGPGTAGSSVRGAGAWVGAGATGVVACCADAPFANPMQHAAAAQMHLNVMQLPRQPRHLGGPDT